VRAASLAAQLIIGTSSAGVTLAWLGSSLPLLFGSTASVQQAAVDAPAALVAAAQFEVLTDNVVVAAGPEYPASPSPIGRLRPGWPVDMTGRTAADLGCADDLTADGLKRFVSEQRGPLLGWDNPHLYPIDEHRTLWIAHDTHVDYSGRARNLLEGNVQMQNVVILQQDNCFTLVHGGTPSANTNFEMGDGRDPSTRFYWPLGGEVVGDVLWLFWAETVQSGNTQIPGDGILRHPERTWLASYDVDSLDRLSFQPAPNDGTFPTYGFAVESDGRFSYLFANTNLLNLTREGGFANGPHSATKMFVGRVPAGRLDLQPEYWNGQGWSNSAESAAVISERFWAENTMQPRYIDGRWISVVKRDGYFGNEIVIDVAENAWGPWIEAERIPYEASPDTVAKNSYHPVLAPWSSPSNGLVIIISENAQHWADAVERTDVYRPTVLHADWPFIVATEPEQAESDEREGRRVGISASADL
jgi:hypothetical protein